MPLLLRAEYSVILLGLDNAGKTTFHEQVKNLFQQPDGTGAAAPTPRPVGKTVPTVGQNVSTVALPDMYLKIWDVGGQLSLRRLWAGYYGSCHAIVFIIDSTDIGDGILLAEDGAGGGAVGVGASTTGSTAAGAGVEAGSGVSSGVGGAGGSGGAGSGKVGSSDGGSIVGGGRLDECRAVLEDVLQSSETEGVPLLILANKQDREDCVEVVRIKEGLVKKVFEGEKAGSIRDSRVLPVSALTGTGVREAVEWVRSRVKWNKESRPPVMR
jgi:ADP-ribosylation factor related protein 1